MRESYYWLDLGMGKCAKWSYAGAQREGREGLVGKGDKKWGCRLGWSLSTVWEGQRETSLRRGRSGHPEDGL